MHYNCVSSAPQPDVLGVTARIIKISLPEEFINIHRADVLLSSVVFRCTADSVETCYNVTRSWQRAGNGVKERLEVTRDQQADKSLTENWSQDVNDIMPVNIAHLFFFDGEKIAACADPDGVHHLAANGVRSLFGIDLVERLKNDLQILERRRQSTTIPVVDKEIIRQKEKELHLLRIEIEQRVKERTVLQTRKVGSGQR